MRKAELEKLVKQLERKLRKAEKLLRREQRAALYWHNAAMEANAVDILAHWRGEDEIRKRTDG